MIERRALDKHLRRPLRSNLCCHPLPVEFRLPRGSQRLPHIQIDQISIRRRPRPRRVAQQRKFNRQPPALLHDKLVYAARVRFQQPANLRARLLRRALRRLPHPEDPILLVDFQRQRPHNLRQIARCRPPKQIHLPKTILRHHVSLRHHQIFRRFRANPRPPPLIAIDNHSLLQSRHRDLPIQPRQRPMHEPPASEQRDPRQHQQRCDYVPCNTRTTCHSAVLNLRKNFRKRSKECRSVAQQFQPSNRPQHETLPRSSALPADFSSSAAQLAKIAVDGRTVAPLIRPAAA